MKTIGCTLISLFLIGTVALADPQYRQRAIAPELRDNRTFRHRDVVRIVDVAQVNPAYVSSYGGSTAYDSATQEDILAQIRTLSARLDQLTALAAAAKTGTPAVVAPSAPNAPAVVVVPPAAPGAVTVVPPARPAGGGAAVGLAVLNGHCAACHQTGKLLPEQRFTLLDAKGNLVTLTDKQKLNVVQKTYHAEMPPPNNAQGILPLTDAEFAAVADLLR